MKEGYFSAYDKDIITNLSYDNAAEPAFDNMRDCLVWPDERPDNLTPDGYEKLQDLFIARSLIFHLTQVKKTSPEVPSSFENAWKAAQKQVPTWPGFRRLTLSIEDREYYTRSMSENDEI